MQRLTPALVALGAATLGFVLVRYAIPTHAPHPVETEPAANADLGKTPSDLPPSFIREGEFPPGTFEGLSQQQKYTVLKVANEKNCTCGCPNDSIAKCRTHDPGCTTAPALLADIIANARHGLSSTQIEAALTASDNQPTALRALDDPSVVYQVPLDDSPVRGNANAAITLVEFADFQCPYSSQVQAALNEARVRLGPDLRIVFKHHPLPFHPQAALAAEAAMAAGDQGKFWEMHDLLFQNQQKLERADLETYAHRLGLDAAKFNAALDTHAHRPEVARDQSLASRLGATGTPIFFANGHKLVGAQSSDALLQFLAPLRAEAERLRSSGTPAGGLYAALTAQGLTEIPASLGAAPAKTSSEIARSVEVLPYNPVRGPATAPVTIVELGDFQCPFSARVEPTLQQLRATYRDQVRWVWRNEPLGIHPLARPAAIAAMAAAEQGKFWEMHDAIFARAPSLETQDLEKDAVQAGVDLARWKKDLSSPRIEAGVEGDASAAAALGAEATPTFFINGRELGGAQPIEAFKAVIDDELRKATGLTGKGISPDEISTRLTAINVAHSPPVETPQVNGMEGGFQVEPGSSPTQGSATAPITVIEYSEFACYFGNAADATLEQMEALYPGQIRRVFKEYPMAIHPDSVEAAKAALAADEQGKFWPMERQLYDHGADLKRANLDSYAKAAGLNLAKYAAAMTSAKLKARLQADVDEGTKLGVLGTPTYFINGRKLVGAQPPDAWRRVIDAELSRLKVSLDGGAGHAAPAP